MRLRTHLGLLVLAVLLPLALLSAVSVALLAKTDREARVAELVERAREAAAAVDAEIEAQVGALQVLAASKHMDGRSLRAAYDEASRVSGHRPGWVNAALIEPSSGQQLFNLRRPFGEGLPRTGNPDLLARVVSTGQPAVSEMLQGRVSGRWLLAIAAPVFRDGSLRYVLAAGLGIERFEGLLRRLAIPLGSTVVLLDRRGALVAASGEARPGAGQPAEAQPGWRDGGLDEGAFRDASGGSGAVYTAFSRSRHHGLLVALSVPAPVVEASMRRWLWILGGTALVVLASVAALAFVLGRRVTLSVGSLWRSAGSPGPAQEGERRRWAVMEVAGIERAMGEAGEVLRRSTEAVDLLSRLKRELGGLLDPRQVTEAILSSVPRIFEVPRALFYRRDPHTGTLVCQGAAGSPDSLEWVGGRLLPGQGVSGRAASERGLVWSRDVLGDPAITIPEGLAPIAREGGYGAMAAAPLVVRGEVVGVLTLADLPGRAFSETDLALLEGLAADAALAMDRSQAYDEARRRRRAAEMLAETARHLSQSLDAAVVSEQVLQSLLGVVGGSGSILCGLDPASGDLVVLGAIGDAAGLLPEATVIPRGEGVLGVAVAQQATVATEDLLSDPRITLPPDLWTRLDGLTPRSALAAPLMAEGRVIGVVGVLDGPGRHWTPEDVSLAEAFADLTALALENARLFGDLRSTLEVLRPLSRRMVDAMEAERRRLALELHDEIGQLLTGLKITLERAERQADDRRARSLAQAQELAGGLINRVREMALDLRPAMLEDLGLVPALLWHLGRYTAQTRVRVAFTHSGLEGRRFTAAVEMAAYRIVQEALTNVARHSGVSEASVILSAGEETLSLGVADEGKGFDAREALRSAAAAGLAGMRERAAALGGTVEIESAPGAGTRVVAALPLGAASAEEGDRR